MLTGDAYPTILNVTAAAEHATPPPDAWAVIDNCGNTVKLVVTVLSQPLEPVNTSVYDPVDV